MNKKILLLWGLLVFLIGVSIITNEYNNSGNSEEPATKNDIIEEDDNNIRLEPPKKSAYAHYREWIHIDGSDPNNWSDTANAYEWCYVENNYYVIENVTIDATNTLLSGGTGILIENSINDYFVIRNCTIANSSGTFLYGAITLENTNNGTIIDNKLIDNQDGIVLVSASNNIIVNNTIEGDTQGIFIFGGFPPVYECYDNFISNNNISNCGIALSVTLEELVSNTIDSSNTVNEKPVYYYVNESGLMPINFTNAGQIMLYYCNHSEIIDVDTSYGSYGIYILNGFNITISHSNITHNNFDGMYISRSENVTVDNCRIIENDRYGILLGNSKYCNISLNYYECNNIGIYLSSSYNTTFKNNTMVRTGVYISFSATPPIPDYIIDTSNTVNGKPIYYYQDKNHLNSANFSDPGQIILVNCNDSVIANFNISSGSYGILVYYSNNLTLSNINVSSHKNSGIYIRDSNNVTVSYTKAEDCEVGLRFYEGKDNTISNNTFSHNDEEGLYISDWFNSLLFNNTIENNGEDGLYLTSSQDINITKSIISNNSEVGINIRFSSNITIDYTTTTENKDGIFLYYGFDCIITMNTILNNSREGITIHGGDDGILTMNDIINNSRYGIYISNDQAVNYLIFNNTFITNGVQNAYDVYGNNFWYNDTLGNSWDDYTGKDSDDNGKGDTPYNIPGGVTQDDYPIYWDPPSSVIITPINYTLYGKNAPSFSGIVSEGIPDTQWYTLGSNPKKYNFTGIFFSDTINQTGWDAFGNGTVLIHFFVNDSRGYISQNDTIVRKGIIPPNITIINPKENNLYNVTAPDFEITITGSSINKSWYRLWNGTEWSTNYTIGGSGSQRSGQINQNAWNDCPNGTVIIEFYANDTFNNIGMNSTTIRKDILGPIITINAPAPNELFNSTAPSLADCDVDFRDVSGIANRWYMLINGTDNTDFTDNYTWNDEVDQSVWNYMDNGTIIIRIFANDSLGNIGRAEVIVRKDILGPIITINNPTPNELFYSTAPDMADCDVLFSDVSGIDAQWHMLINATNSNHYTKNYTWNGEVNQTAWNQMGNGTVIIRIFANDSLDYIGMAEVTVRKDIEPPSIDITEPVLGKVFGNATMNFTISVSGRNLDTIWYMLVNGTNSNDYTKNVTYSDSVITGIYEAPINYNLWNQFENGTIIIRFFLNRTSGPMAFDEVMVRKDIIAPEIKIIEPIANQSVYSTPPEFIITVVEANKDTMWYRLFNGTHYTKNHTFSENTKIEPEAWNPMWKFIDYGEIIWIIFYCNDTAGNIGFANVTVIKTQALPDGVLPPSDGDDDDDGKKAEEGFDIALIVLIIIGVSGGIVVAGIIFIKKRISGKKRIKEIERIERLG